MYNWTLDGWDLISHVGLFKVCTSCEKGDNEPNMMDMPNMQQKNYADNDNFIHST